MVATFFSSALLMALVSAAAYEGDGVSMFDPVTREQTIAVQLRFQFNTTSGGKAAGHRSVNETTLESLQGDFDPD